MTLKQVLALAAAFLAASPGAFAEESPDALTPSASAEGDWFGLRPVSIPLKGRNGIGLAAGGATELSWRHWNSNTFGWEISVNTNGRLDATIAPVSKSSMLLVQPSLTGKWNMVQAGDYVLVQTLVKVGASYQNSEFNNAPFLDVNQTLAATLWVGQGFELFLPVFKNISLEGSFGLSGAYSTTWTRTYLSDLLIAQQTRYQATFNTFYYGTALSTVQIHYYF